MTKIRINCFKCKYFFITWEKAKPRGCGYFGFKSKMLPSSVVLKSSGNPCKAFTRKENEN
ncbi:hypothetical protein [Dethiothermospora halolimnae]|uniref:hypothetical protein n=1 Tax=Dethiothermospora halolimnae TaxID=3114390 RepID=UPI003CCC2721